MAATVVNRVGQKTLHLSSKLRSLVYYCEACVKVLSGPHTYAEYLQKQLRNVKCLPTRAVLSE